MNTAKYVYKGKDKQNSLFEENNLKVDQIV